MKHLNNRGQGLIEYLIIVALMAVATISVLSVVGSSMTRRFANIAHVIQGDSERVDKVDVRETQYKKKDLGTFLNGSTLKQNGGNSDD